MVRRPPPGDSLDHAGEASVTRPLTSDQLHATGIRLRAIADELLADHAGAVQRNLAAAADPTPWPSSTGSAGSGQGGGSPVELATLATPTPTEARAARLLAWLHQLVALAAHVDPGLLEWSPARTIARCPACGDPLRPDRRCTTCGAREGAKRLCADCLEPEDRHGLRPWPPQGWTGYVDGAHRVLCVRDWMWRHRHEGRPRVGIQRLALGANMIELPEQAAG